MILLMFMIVSGSLLILLSYFHCEEYFEVQPCWI